MPFTKFLIINLLTLLLLVDFGVAQPLVQKLNETASVDWSRQVILTSGSSASLPPDSDASQRIAEGAREGEHPGGTSAVDGRCG